MLIIKRKHKDRLLINTAKEFKNGHTHIPHYIFHKPNKVAKQIKFNVENRRLPRHSKFVNKNVGNKNFDRYVESHIRVCVKGCYRDKLIEYRRVHNEKVNDYVNIQKGVR